MGILSRIFGSGKAVEEVVTGIKSGVDKVWFTAEEQADATANLLKLYEPFKLAQRYLSLLIIGTFCSLSLVGGVVYLLCAAFTDWQTIEVGTNPAFIMVLERYFENIVNGSLGTLAITVGLFYFGGGMAEGIAGKVMDKVRERKT